MFIRYSLIWIISLLIFACSNETINRGETHLVEIKQMKFIPNHLSVVPGDSIKWINKDIVDHDVSDANNNLLNSKKLKTNQTYSIKIGDIQKEIDYICSIHPVMKGKITVETSK